jgi:S1-C subfamily serine protease
MAPMRTLIHAFLTAAALLAAAPAQAQETATAPARAASQPEAAAAAADIRKSLVKIFTTVREPNLSRPWQKQNPQDQSGTGVVIDGKRILTNAHVVAYHSRVLVQPDGSSDKLIGKVEAVAPGIDLAIVKLEDESFFDTHPAATIADELPEVGQTVEAYGYPIGGEALSVTKGIVSRIEFAPYNFGVLGLRIQVDAALNHGNSGGPAIMNGKIIGLVFSGIDEAQNIGYLIPAEELQIFLADAGDGKYDSKPQLYVSMQTLENSALREKLGAGKDVAGMVITQAPDDGAKGSGEPALKQWDIITAIGGTPIDNAGMVQIRNNLRLEFNYLIHKFAKDGKVPLSVLREGKQVEVQAPVYSDPPRIMKFLGHRYPSYAVIGPLVFTPVYADLLSPRTSFVLTARKSPIVRRAGDAPLFEGEELVTICPPFLPHKLTKGYELQFFAVLGKVNGTKVKSLRHLVEMIKNSKDEYLTFEWDDDSTETMVFKREELLGACEEIYEDNGIRSPVSDDLKDIWDKK